MRPILKIGCLAFIGMLLAGCHLQMQRPTPTTAPNAPLITTLAPNGGITPPEFPVAQGTPINPDCPATPSTWIIYTVVTGDSLGLLAQQTSSSIDELVAGNCLSNPDELFVGQVIYLPSQPVVSP
jgi:LysM domain-containing protein